MSGAIPAFNAMFTEEAIQIIDVLYCKWSMDRSETWSTIAQLMAVIVYHHKLFT